MKGLRVAGGAEWSRRIIDELTEVSQGGGARGLAWMKVDDAGALAGGVGKFFADVADELKERAEAGPGDLLLFVAGPEKVGAAAPRQRARCQAFTPAESPVDRGNRVLLFS